MDLAIIPYENEKHYGLKNILKTKTDIKKIGILIGPEGGFDINEIDKCLKNNVHPITLGPRILRTETAGFVAAAIILYELGDMGGII
jgi:16S rRNA (uracil1498-N3)-methyltransferase